MLKSVLLLVQVVSVICFFNVPKQEPQRSLGNTLDHDAALFLTPYIESGKISEGQQASKVYLKNTDVESFSGYLTVNKAYNSNLFFWYFPAEKNPENAPVVLWLQGGPGSSSLFGLFTENGPFFVNKSGHLSKRSHYWSQVANLIYIDNPVGTGFSFTDNDNGYVKDEVAIGRDLYSALTQFLQLFPHLQENEVYLTGESYAGKYVPAIAYTIHENNPTASLKINLKGLAIGNGYSAPELMLDYSDYLYQLGLIDSNGKQVFEEKENQIKTLIQKEKWLEAADNLYGLVVGYPSWFYNLTGFSMFYNFLHTGDYAPFGDMNTFLERPEVKKSIHVGPYDFSSGSVVQQYLMEDFPQSVKPWVETLLENYRVIIYNGQLDIIVAYPLTVNFIQALDWSGAEQYKTAERKPWYVGDDLAGYSKTVKQFTEVLVRNAGHMVPMDQPEWALDLITRLVSKKPF